MSLPHLKRALEGGDRAQLLRYVRLHLGDGDKEAGRREIDKAWVEALGRLLDSPPTDREFIETAVRDQDPATLAHLFFRLHFHLVQQSGDWIHDGSL